MKNLVLFLLLLQVLLVNCGPPKKLKDSIASVRHIMQAYAPCYPGWYCYEYDLQISKNEIIVTTRRFNYHDNEEKKFLALSAHYSVPVNEITSVTKFPATDDSILIKTDGKVIKLNTDGETKLVDYLALDFNQLFSYDNQMTVLLNDLHKIINHYQEVL